ncbi:MAG: N-acetyltransferase [Candidatus Margulisbacteria bacterium]|nr:N-acetyltransferase [Candidatus Margulisiibacteriota bacterium]
MQISIRKAILTDSEKIHSLIQHFAKKGIMLARSQQYIYDHVRDFFVAIKDKQVVGICAFTVSQKDLAEVKSLAVDEKHQKSGIARQLIENGINDLKELGVKKVFCLTYVPGLFEKMGFTQVAKESLPHKIWTECINCPSFPDCDEIALTKEI